MPNSNVSDCVVIFMCWSSEDDFPNFVGRPDIVVLAGHQMLGDATTFWTLAVLTSQGGAPITDLSTTVNTSPTDRFIAKLQGWPAAAAALTAAVHKHSHGGKFVELIHLVGWGWDVGWRGLGLWVQGT